MLLSHEIMRGELASELDTVHNYYEVLVIDELRSTLNDDFHNTEYFADIACVALNHLPPRYIRHDVDMAFYLSPNERQEIVDKVKEAAAAAIKFVNDSAKTYD